MKIKWFTREYKATFYMKSGNVITIGNIESFNVKNRGGAITEYEFTWRLPALAPSCFNIDLREVEALVIQ